MNRQSPSCPRPQIPALAEARRSGPGRLSRRLRPTSVERHDSAVGLVDDDAVARDLPANSVGPSQAGDIARPDEPIGPAIADAVRLKRSEPEVRRGDGA